MYEVPRGYMDEQYTWLEQLIKLADDPIPEPKCKNNLQRFENPRTSLEE
jgi:hypothetical protein